MSAEEFFLLTFTQTAIGIIIDLLVGDPRWFPHPARGVGRVISLAEEILRAQMTNLRLAGLFLTFITVTISVIPVIMLQAGCWYLDTSVLCLSFPWLTAVSGGVICGIWFSFRSLAGEAEEVCRLLKEHNLPAARKALSMIVGRDTESLTEQEIARAAIETVAENSVDGGISPVCFSMLGGPALTTIFKAVSTLDSMVGYKSEEYRELGTASARLDDALNYLPARLSLLLIPLGALVCGLSPVSSLRAGIRDGRKHPSPNAAISESLFAGALKIQLGGISSYRGVISNKPLLGDAIKPISVQDIRRSQHLLFSLDALLFAVTAGAILLICNINCQG